MKKNRKIVILLCMAFAVAGCTNQAAVPKYAAGDKTTFTAGEYTFSMIYVPAETFFTGTDDKGTAAVDKPFWIGETEVTYGLCLAVTAWAITEGGYNFSMVIWKGAANKGSDRQPVTTINWQEAALWCNALTEWLNARTGSHYTCAYRDGDTPIRDFTGQYAFTPLTLAPAKEASGFRLPLSTEWELAARFKADLNNDGDIMDAGEYYPGNFASGAAAPYTDPDETGKVAVCDTTDTAVVKSKVPNALGIYDMSGNVEEWCFDWYPGSEGKARAVKGGNWIYGGEIAQVGLTMPHDPFNEYFLGGFRFARSE